MEESLRKTEAEASDGQKIYGEKPGTEAYGEEPAVTRAHGHERGREVEGSLRKTEAESLDGQKIHGGKTGTEACGEESAVMETHDEKPAVAEAQNGRPAWMETDEANPALKENPGEQRYLPRLTEAEVRALAPLTLAFIGDAAYELCNRTRLVQEADRNPRELQKMASAFARAPFQSAAMEILEPLLTEKELGIYHRGRNAKSQTKAKNATVQEYRRATGFEAVLGYLYLTGSTERMLELIRLANEGA